jgi:hypothetical protein
VARENRLLRQMVQDRNAEIEELIKYSLQH